MSDKPTSAESTYVCILYEDKEDDDEELYYLGKRFGGDSRRTMHTPCNKEEEEGKEVREYSKEVENSTAED